MPSPTLLLFSIILLSSSLCSNATQNIITRVVGTTLSSVDPSSSVCSSFSKRSTASGGRTLTIMHGRGPCSPLGSAGGENIDSLLLDDERHFAGLQDSKAATVPTRRGLDFHTTNYVVTVGVGTPGKDQTVSFSTTASLTWIQCRPCVVSCYQQNLPVFDPSASSSYRTVPCSSAACAQLPLRSCADGKCLYGMSYTDGSSTAGLLVQETLRLTSADVIPNAVMGCGQNNKGSDFGGTSGVLGLGRAPLSVLSQASRRFGGVFSYCLPVRPTASGELTFGPASENGNMVYTPMVPGSDMYMVELTGVSVGGRMLQVPTTRLVVSAGAVFTRLPTPGYAALRAAFRGGMADYKLGEQLGQLDTCYDVTGKTEVSVPTVALHLRGGAVVDLSFERTMFLGGETHLCLAFAAGGDSGVGVLGGIQQRGMQVVFDAGRSRIGFGRGSCSL